VTALPCRKALGAAPDRGRHHRREMPGKPPTRRCSSGDQMAAIRKIVLVSPHGFCAGVKRAVEMADALLRLYPKPVYCLKEIVHNRQVIDGLASRGIVFVTDVAQVPVGATVLFSAHGVPPTVRAVAASRHLRVIDGTCPFVGKVHREVRRFADRGYSVLLIGHRHHDEIIGVAGEAPDRVTVVETEAQAREVQVPDPAKVAVMTQTTLSAEETEHTLAILRRRFPALQTPSESDICYATRNRQQAVRLFARRADAFIVLGSRNSSNSNRLVEVARAEGCRAHLVSSTADLAGVALDGVDTLGLTAGASTPEHFVHEIIAALKARGFTHFEETAAVKENVHFALPCELREDATRL